MQFTRVKMQMHCFANPPSMQFFYTSRNLSKTYKTDVVAEALVKSLRLCQSA